MSEMFKILNDISILFSVKKDRTRGHGVILIKEPCINVYFI